MFLAQKMRIYCATDKAHISVIRDKSDDLLRLTLDNNVHVLSPSEAADASAVHPHDGRNVTGQSDDGLHIAKVFDHLNSQWLGHTLVHLPTTASTQDVLKKTVPWCDAGWVALTGLQSAGRGRRGTCWTSPMGSVAISIALRIDATESEKLTFMQYIAALAAVEAVKMPGWDGLKLQVKWPNDIYKDGLKVGGVLCEGVLRGRVFEIVVGIGVNVTNEAPTTCLMPDGGTDAREKFVGHYLTAFEKLYDQFCERGFEGALNDKYVAAWMHSGQEVRLGGSNGPRAVVKGLAPNGWVRVFRDDLQAFQDLAPDETSLDIVQGVMKEKRNGYSGDGS